MPRRASSRSVREQPRPAHQRQPEGARGVREEDTFDVAAVAGWLRENADARGAGRPGRGPGGAAVLRRRVEPDLPAALPRARPHPADGAARHQGPGGPRHGPGVPHPGPAPAGLPLRARDDRLLRRPRGDGARLLRHGAGRGPDPAWRPARRRAHPRAGPRHEPGDGRRARRAARRRPRGRRPGRARQGLRLRAPPDRGLVAPLPRRPHRRRPRLRARHGLARRAPARGRRQLRDPQRLQARQPRLRRRRPARRWSPSSTGRWPPSATR